MSGEVAIKNLTDAVMYNKVLQDTKAQAIIALEYMDKICEIAGTPGMTDADIRKNISDIARAYIETTI